MIKKTQSIFTRVSSLLFVFSTLGCGSSIESLAGGPTATVDVPSLMTTLSALYSPTPTPEIIHSETPQPTEPPTITPTAKTAPIITVYNMYVGKDPERQKNLIKDPLIQISSIRDAEGYENSYVSIFLRGATVGGTAIEGNFQMLSNLIRLMDAARENSFTSQTIYSSYRSYDKQVFLENKNAAEYDVPTDIFLAVPGRSEHQLGTVVDIGWGTEFLNFYMIYNNSTAGQFYDWLLENAHKFGFVFSYPHKSNEDATVSNIFQVWVTEYKAEPWHLRFIGIDFATEVYNSLDDHGRNYLDPTSKIIPQDYYFP